MAKLNSGTLHLTDEEFLIAFESCELAGNMFHHADHVRAAWLYIRSYGEAEAVARLCEGIRRFASHHGGARKYHHTMSAAWVRLIAAAQRETPDIEHFGDFLATHPWLLDMRALSKYYSASRLGSATARAGWVEPDLQTLP